MFLRVNYNIYVIRYESSFDNNFLAAGNMMRNARHYIALAYYTAVHDSSGLYNAVRKLSLPVQVADSDDRSSRVDV